MNPLTTLKKALTISLQVTTLLFIYLFIYLFIHLFSIPISLKSLGSIHFPNPRFENMRFTVGSPYRPFR
jgi:hypothetical protein